MESVIEGVMQKMTLLLNEQAELHEFIPNARHTPDYYFNVHLFKPNDHVHDAFTRSGPHGSCRVVVVHILAIFAPQPNG